MATMSWGNRATSDGNTISSSLHPKFEPNRKTLRCNHEVQKSCLADTRASRAGNTTLSFLLTKVRTFSQTRWRNHEA